MDPVSSCAACLLCGSKQLKCILLDFLHIDDRKCTVKLALRRIFMLSSFGKTCGQTEQHSLPLGLYIKIVPLSWAGIA